MPRDRSRSPVDRDRRRRSRERERDRERRRRRDRSRSADHAESPQRGRDRRERDTTPVYESRTGIPPASDGSSGNYGTKKGSVYNTEHRLIQPVRTPFTLWFNHYIIVTFQVQMRIHHHHHMAILVVTIQQQKGANSYGTEKENA